MVDGPVKASAIALERHYTVAEVAKLWGWGETKVRELFRTEPGVLRSQPLRTLRARKSQHTSRRVALRIPESILLPVHARLADAGE